MPFYSSTIPALSAASRKTILRSVISTFVGIAILRVAFVSFFSIPSPSMQPSLLVGDYVIVWTCGTTWHNVCTYVSTKLSGLNDNSSVRFSRNDIIVFRSPIAARFGFGGSDLLVKRIAGVPGDTVYVDSEFPFGGDHRVPTRGDKIDLTPRSAFEWKTLIEGEGHKVSVHHGIVYIDSNTASSYTIENNYYFVVGDNSKNSYDSRYWGYVSEASIIGQPSIVYWSVSSKEDEAPSSLATSDSLQQSASIRWSRIFHRIQ